MPAGSELGARESFFRERFPDFWASSEGHDYALFDRHRMRENDVAELRTACADAWHIYRRAFEVLRAMPDDALRAMGIPETALRVCRLSYPDVPETVVGRFDFIRSDDGFKVIEFNAETPFFVWESNRINGEIARAFGDRDPNAGCEEALGHAFARAVSIAAPAARRLVITAYNPYREDYFTAQYVRDVLSRAIPNRRIDFAALHELHIKDGALHDESGRVDILYRMYPLEHFARDEGGTALFDLVERGALTIINPPSALLLQTKAAQVVIWGLAQAGAFFDDAERRLIAKRFLPTFSDLPGDGEVYVAKPVLGREGNGVRIVRGAAIIDAAARTDYDDQPRVFQRFVESPLVAYRDPRLGAQMGHAISTCFVVGGEPGAVGLRVARGTITDEWAHFLPVSYAK